MSKMAHWTSEEEDLDAGVAPLGPVEVDVSRWAPRRLLDDLLRVPPPIAVSAWCDQHIVLDEKSSPEPGPWRTSRAPYLREIMDAFGTPGIQRISVKASSQVGKTVSMFNMVCYASDRAPGTTIYVMPDEETAKKIVKDRILPTIAQCRPARRRLVGTVDDQGQARIEFDRMLFYPAWSNSPASLASFPCRYVFLDEVNKYPRFSGREADPVALASERTKNFWNKCIVLVSTPTTPDGAITVSYAQSDRRTYHVPCPHCGKYQELQWPHVHWPAEQRDPEVIYAQRLAWYECVGCGERIEDRHKPGMLSSGAWCPEGCTVAPDGTLQGDVPATSHRGYHLSALYSPWVPYAAMAAEWLRAQGNAAALMNFINSWLGQEWVERDEAVTLSTAEAAMHRYAPGVVPEGATVLTAGVDVQKALLVWVVRAWAPSGESWLVDYGRVATGAVDTDWATLAQEVFLHAWPRADGGTPMHVRLGYVDSGYRTDEVYTFVRKHRDVLRAVKGSSRTLHAPQMATTVDRDPRTGARIKGAFTLWILDTGYFKDKVQRMRTSAPCEWHIFRETTREYQREITAEEKVKVRDTKGRVRLVWQLRPGHSDNHYWDAEVYAAAAAEVLGIGRGLSRSVPDDQVPVSKDGKRWLPKQRGGWL